MNDDTLHIVLLADGTELIADAGEGNDELWVWMRNADDPMNTIPFLVNLFSSEEATKVITYKYGRDSETEFYGFTRIDTVKTEPSGTISIRMKKKS